MADELSADDLAMIERAMKAMSNPNRRVIPAAKVKLFLQMVGDELKRTGSLKHVYVNGIANQLKSGAL
jgi:hypothetical protein